MKSVAFQLVPSEMLQYITVAGWLACKSDVENLMIALEVFWPHQNHYFVLLQLFSKSASSWNGKLLLSIQTVGLDPLYLVYPSAFLRQPSALTIDRQVLNVASSLLLFSWYPAPAALLLSCTAYCCLFFIGQTSGWFGWYDGSCVTERWCRTMWCVNDCDGWKICLFYIRGTFGAPLPSVAPPKKLSPR